MDRDLQNGIHCAPMLTSSIAVYDSAFRFVQLMPWTGRRTGSLVQMGDLHWGWGWWPLVQEGRRHDAGWHALLRRREWPTRAERVRPDAGTGIFWQHIHKHHSQPESSSHEACLSERTGANRSCMAGLRVSARRAGRLGSPDRPALPHHVGTGLAHPALRGALPPPRDTLTALHELPRLRPTRSCE